MSDARGPGALFPIVLALLFIFSILANVPHVSAYSPQNGDYFRYSETTRVGSGQGSYLGYTDQTLITGTEQFNSVSGSNILSHFSYSFDFSNNQGNSSSGSKSGDFTWSASTYTYVNGTDNQVGYSAPLYVWFAMNPSLPPGGAFWALNTHLAVNSKNYSLLLPTEGRYVQTILAVGTGTYQRNDAYGIFSATYTWDEYFDPITGYIIGYNYTEHDTGSYQGQAGSFVYSDALYLTSASYSLATASAPPVSPGSGVGSFAPYLGFIVPAAVVSLVIVTVVLAVRQRRKPLPEHSPSPPPTPYAPPPSPWASTVDIGSKPSEQVVIRDVAKVNCRYCGTLIPTTVDHCPYCGAPRE